jgi:hypothetical protein
MFLSTWYLKPNPNDPDSSHMTFSAHTDPKGALPHWIINKAMESEVTGTHTKMVELFKKK